MAINTEQSEHFNSLVGKPSSNIRLALIENAADVYPKDNQDWVIEHRIAIKNNGYSVDQINLNKYLKNVSELEEELKKFDAIWLGGGNTYYLRWILRESGADQVITKLVTNGLVYGGGSAGAIVAGPTLKHFEEADDPNQAQEAIYDGLGLTEIVPVPHIDNETYASVLEEAHTKLEHDGFQTAPLTDNQVLVIDGLGHQVIG